LVSPVVNKRIMILVIAVIGAIAVVAVMAAMNRWGGSASNDGTAATNVPSQQPTPTATQSTLAPASAVTPSPEEPSVLGQIIRNEIATIRVMDQTMMDYKAGETPFFTSADSRIMIFPAVIMPLTPEVLSQISNQLRIVSASSAQEVRYSIDLIKPGESNEVPLSVQLHDAPKENIELRFTSKDGAQSKHITLHYTEPLRYSLSSEDDPSIFEYVSLLQQGIYKSHYIEPGKSYVYRMEFTHDMDRDSVEKSLSESISHSTLHSVQWRWEDDKRLRITLDSRQQPEGSVLNLSMRDVRGANGLSIFNDRGVTIQVSRKQALYRIQLAKKNKDRIAEFPVHYSEIDISPNGKYALAIEEASNEMYGLQAYTLMSLDGKIMRTYNVDEIHLVQWLQGGEFIVYLQNNQVILDHVSSGTSKVIWTPPDKNERSRAVSLDIDSRMEQVVVGWGTHDDEGMFTYDLYVLSDIHSKELKSLYIPKVGSYSCYEGPCYAPGYRSISNGEMILEWWQEARGQGREQQWGAYRLNLASGKREETKPIHAPLQTGSIGQVVELEGGEQLRLEGATDSGTESWSLYDPNTGAESALFTTSLGLFKSWGSTVMQLHASEILVHVRDQSWQVIKIESKKIKQYDLIPSHVNTVTKHGNELYFFSYAD
jgi:hypothetical protein